MSQTCGPDAMRSWSPTEVETDHPLNAEHVLRVADIEIQPCPVPAR